jgi:hypothetical protein
LAQWHAQLLQWHKQLLQWHETGKKLLQWHEMPKLFASMALIYALGPKKHAAVSLSLVAVVTLRLVMAAPSSRKRKRDDEDSGGASSDQDDSVMDMETGSDSDDDSSSSSSSSDDDNNIISNNNNLPTATSTTTTTTTTATKTVTIPDTACPDAADGLRFTSHARFLQVADAYKHRFPSNGVRFVKTDRSNERQQTYSMICVHKDDAKKKKKQPGQQQQQPPPPPPPTCPFRLWMTKMRGKKRGDGGVLKMNFTQHRPSCELLAHVDRSKNAKRHRRSPKDPDVIIAALHDKNVDVAPKQGKELVRLAKDELGLDLGLSTAYKLIKKASNAAPVDSRRLIGQTPAYLTALENANPGTFTLLEKKAVPVVVVVDGNKGTSTGGTGKGGGGGGAASSTDSKRASVAATHTLHRVIVVPACRMHQSSCAVAPTR